MLAVKQAQLQPLWLRAAFLNRLDRALLWLLLDYVVILVAKVTVAGQLLVIARFLGRPEVVFDG